MAALDDAVAALTTQTTALLAAVNVSKGYIDVASAIAVGGISGSTASPTPAVGKSPIGNASGKFSAAWIDPTTPISVSAISATGTVAVSTLEGLRIVADAGIITGYNTANSVRSGFIQFNAGGASSINVDLAQPLAFSTSGAERMRLDASGNLLVGVTSGGFHRITKAATAALGLLEISSTSTALRTAVFLAVDAENFSGTNTALFVGKNTGSGRSINAGGTVNASGADYAEYMPKAANCGDIAKGQIVGVGADGRLTDCWHEAVSFLVKSTAPSYVGGDTWGSDEALGLTRPTDIECETYEARLAVFNAALEAARVQVDRIAFCGQVPVNVFGTMPGQYIVPEQDGEGIKGVAMSEADITFAQYMRAVGKVIAVDLDGRARIIVKVA
jgi:hypothetical protein